MKWSTLECASGAATDVPRLIEQLTDEKDLRRLQAFSLLRGQLALGGRWFSASAPAIRLLVEVAQQPGKDRHRPLWLVSEIAAGGPCQPFVVVESPNGGDPLQTAVRQAVNESASGSTLLLGDAEPRVRAAACEVLGLTSEGRERLLQHVESEDAELPTASAIVALSLDTTSKARVRPLVERYLDDERAVVRLAAWLSALRIDLDVAERRAHEMVHLLSTDECPWEFAGRSLSTLLANLAAPVATRLRQSVARSLVNALSDSPKPTVAQECEWPRLILFLAGMPVDFSYDPRGYDQSPKMRLPEEVTPEQRELLLSLNGRDLRFAGTDVPWDTLTRRRWLGATEPTALEKRVPSRNGGPLWPVWRAWQEVRELEGERSRCLPEALYPHLTGAERIEALLLASRDAYGLKAPWSDEERQLVSTWSAEHPDASIAVAGRFLDDDPPQTSERAVAVRILVRSKRVMRPEWDACALTMVKNLKRIDLELLEAIPPDRREPIALQGAVDLIGLEQSPEVLRLAPTAAVAERFLAAIDRFAAAAKGDTKRLLDTARKGIDVVASQHPPLQSALAKKRA